MKIKITESQYVRLQEQKVKGEEITPGKYVVQNTESELSWGNVI